MKNLTPDMIEKAKTAKSAEELFEIAKANGVEMTADEAATYFAQLNPKSGELNDDDLDNVAGGACNPNLELKNGQLVRVINGNKCPKCGGTVGKYNFAAGYGAWTRVDCDTCNEKIIGVTGELQLGVDIELI